MVGGGSTTVAFVTAGAVDAAKSYRSFDHSDPLHNMKIDLLFEFSVTKKEDAQASRGAVEAILVPHEEIQLAYTHVRDKVWFTNKRIIAMDVQGLLGAKSEFRTFPYSKISSFSIETAGTFDGDSDFKIWVSGVGVFGVKFHRSLDIKEVGRFLSEKLLQA